MITCSSKSIRISEASIMDLGLSWHHSESVKIYHHSPEGVYNLGAEED